jgi:tubulin polyglutamylase TTLL6/13
MEDLDLETVWINTSCSQYPVMSEVAKTLGWEVDQDDESESWDVFWTDSAIDSQQLFKMHHFQKINHFPGMEVLARKNLLAKGLMKMRKEFPEEYCFFPLTWLLPA